jgi:Phage major capsid protein E
MPQMTPAQARAIDPILTSVAQGYENNDFVGTNLFPKVPVKTRGGKILSFGKEDFMLYNTGRAPGQNTKRVQFGFLTGSFALESHSLEGVMPIELGQEAVATEPNVNLGSITVNKTQDIIGLRLEKAQADLARNASNYAASNKITLSGTGQWSDFTSGVSDPVAVIETGKEAVRQKIGKRPNVAVIGALVFAALKQHPKIVDRIKYTGRDIATPELLASLFGLEKVYIGDAVFADDAGTFSDVWGKDVVLAYAVTGSVAEQGKPTYGYTYQLEGYAVVEEPYYDRSAKSWIYPVTDEVAPVIAGALAGYLITNAVA